MIRSSRFAAALAAAALAAAAPAGAQTSNSPLTSGEMMNLISATDVTSMMTELGITTEMVTSESTSGPFLVATTPGGAKFLFRFLGCEDAVNLGNCRNTVVTAAVSSAGVTYDDINEFNIKAIITTAVNIPGEQIIILGRNILIAGGHARELYQATVYTFLMDVQSFVDSKQSTTSVAFAPSPEKASKITGIGTHRVTDAPSMAFGLSDLSGEVASAIANTRDVHFAIDDAPEF